MKKAKARCPKCGAFLPRRFIFLPGHLPKVVKFNCAKCGVRFAFKTKVRPEASR